MIQRYNRSVADSAQPAYSDYSGGSSDIGLNTSTVTDYGHNWAIQGYMGDLPLSAYKGVTANMGDLTL